jgi:hypothetical protein
LVISLCRNPETEIHQEEEEEEEEEEEKL